MYKILCFITPICRWVLWYSVVWFDIQVTLHTRLISVLSVIQRMPLLFTEVASHCSVCPLSLYPGIKTNMHAREKRILATAAPSLKCKKNPLGERGMKVWIYGKLDELHSSEDCSEYTFQYFHHEYGSGYYSIFLWSFFLALAMLKKSAKVDFCQL